MRVTASSSRAIARLCLLVATVGAAIPVTRATATETLPSLTSDPKINTPLQPIESAESAQESSNLSSVSTSSLQLNPETEATQNFLESQVSPAITAADLLAQQTTPTLETTDSNPNEGSSTTDSPTLDAETSQPSSEPTTVNQPATGIDAAEAEPTEDNRITAANLEIAPADDPRVPADGRSIIRLQGRITDEQGQLLQEDRVVTLTASAGRFVGADYDAERPGFQVLAQQGQFTAQLQSTLEAQQVRVRAAVDKNKIPDRKAEVGAAIATTTDPIENQDTVITAQAAEFGIDELETYTQVEFVTHLRPSLVTGSINLRLGEAGTDFYGSFADFLDPDLLDEGTEFDVNASVFAIGAIGEWLFTGAYNSDRPLNETCDGTTRLFRDDQFCEQNYPVYGDSSTVTYLTPSTDSVYLRFERTSPIEGAEADYGMWGDYSTREFARASQFYTASPRQLHGFKANYNLGDLQATVLYGNNIEAFQRDVIVPDGTSGYYFLSQRLVVPGSENVFIEAEELNRPGTVLERQPLNRGPDYEIDYDRGAILFRRPLLAIEFDPFGKTLVRRIVVTYQSEPTGDNSEGGEVYAGRLQYNFSRELGQESWAGVTYWQEDQGIRDFELYGFDFLMPLGSEGQLVAEFARSSNDSIFQGNITGSAYRLEASGKITPDIEGRAYYRSVDEGFANNATYSFTPGQTRYGAAIAARVSPTTRFNVEYDREVNYGIAPLVRTELPDLFDPRPEPIPGSAVNNTLTTISAGIQQQIGAAALSVEWVGRDREDRANPELFDSDTSQLVSRLALPLSETLTFRAQNELNLGEDDPLYPDRTTFGIDWSVIPGVTVRLAHQFYSGGLFSDNSITSLDTILEHHLSKNTSITGRYSVIGGFNTITGQGAVGLNHRWAIAPGLRMNLSYEHIFSNILTPTAAGPRFAQPYAVGQSASSLGLLGGDSFSVGLEYTDNPYFKASARIEHRTSSAGDNTVISAAAAGKLSPALTALARYQQANASNQLLSGLLDTANFKLGLAYRDPSSDQFNALLRYEYRLNPATTPDTLLFGVGSGSTEHLFALESIYAPNWRWEFYGKYALRNNRSYGARELGNTNSISLAQLRATYRLGYRMDLSGEVRWIGQSTTDFSELGFVMEAGYYLTPNLRLAAGYSFGDVDDRDFNGSRSEGGFYIGLNLKLNELFDGFGLQKVAPPQQQESVVEPVAVESPNSPTSDATPTETSSLVNLTPAVSSVLAGDTP